LSKHYAPGRLIDPTEMKYEIKQEGPYTSYTATETDKGMKIVVNVKEDYERIQKLASTIKTQYDSIIKANNLSEFTIDLIIDSPSCKLCRSKTYNFFYDRRNNNM
jgi:hypothetical protein